jgi:hypothetical protein
VQTRDGAAEGDRDVAALGRLELAVAVAGGDRPEEDEEVEDAQASDEEVVAVFFFEGTRGKRASGRGKEKRFEIGEHAWRRPRVERRKERR